MTVPVDARRVLSDELRASIQTPSFARTESRMRRENPRSSANGFDKLPMVIGPCDVENLFLKAASLGFSTGTRETEQKTVSPRSEVEATDCRTPLSRPPAGAEVIESIVSLIHQNPERWDRAWISRGVEN